MSRLWTLFAHCQLDYRLIEAKSSTLSELPGEVADHLGADEDHATIAELVMWRLRVLAFLGHLGKPAEHLVARNPHAVKARPLIDLSALPPGCQHSDERTAIIETSHGAVHLRTDFASTDAGHEAVVLERAHLSRIRCQWLKAKKTRAGERTLDDEGVRAYALAVEHKLGLDDAVRGHQAEAADPPLSRADRGRVQLKLLAFRNVRRRRLELFGDFG